jgi:hypothetical protein
MDEQIKTLEKKAFKCIGREVYNLNLNQKKDRINLYERLLKIKKTKRFDFLVFRTYEKCKLTDFINLMVNDIQDRNKLKKLSQEICKNFLDYIKFAESAIIFLNDKNLAKEFYELALDNAKENIHYIIIIDSIIEFNKEWGISLYKSIENSINSFCDYISLAESINSSLKDKKWIKKIYSNVEKNIKYYWNDISCYCLNCEYKKYCKNPEYSFEIAFKMDSYKCICYLWLSESILLNLADKLWAMRIFQLAKEKADNFLCYILLGEYSIKYFDDKIKAKKFYNLAKLKINNFYDYLDLIESVAKYLKDEFLLKEICLLAEQIAEESYHYEYLIKYISKYIKDEKWIKRLYKKALKKFKDEKKLNFFTNLVKYPIKDLKLKKLLKESLFFKEKDANSFEDILIIAKIKIILLKEKKEVKKTLKEIENNLNFLNLIQLSEFVIEFFNDKVWAKKIYKKALKKADSRYDFFKLAEEVYEYLQDKTFAIEVYKKFLKTKLRVGFSDYLKLAEEITKNLGDKKLALYYYNLAQSKINKQSDWKELKDSMFIFLGINS